MYQAGANYQSNISRKGKIFQKDMTHKHYGNYSVPISRKDYICLQLGTKLKSFNRICRTFLEHIGPEYFIVQTHQHGHPYQVALFTDVKPDDGSIAWASNTQLHLAMYELMSEYLWDAQNKALELYNAEQARRLEELARDDAAVDARYFSDPELLEDVKTVPWDSPTVGTPIAEFEAIRELGRRNSEPFISREELRMAWPDYKEGSLEQSVYDSNNS